MKQLAALMVATAFALPMGAQAKLPPPSPEAKAKADEAKAKTAWSDKVSAFQLCKAQDRVAARYMAASSPAAKPAPSACVDPGPFVYDPNAPQPAVAAPATPATTPTATPPATAPAPAAAQAAAAPAKK